jgi:hypothetical protein
MTLSPQLPSGLACDTAGSGPAGAELSRMTELALSRGARSIAIGGGRSAAAAEAVTAFARRWEASGAIVLTVVTWPEEAASWLRQATRFAAADPDLWIMAGTPRGWAQMTRRLLWSTPWQPGRTLAFAALGTRHTARDRVRRRSQPARPCGRHGRRRHLDRLQRQHPGRPAR